MKKQLLTLALMFVGAMAQAQISKGDVQLTGTLNYSTQEVNNADINVFMFPPQTGLFLSDNTSLGIRLSYTNQEVPLFNQNTGNLEPQTTNTFQYGVYARFYKKLIDNFYMYLQPSFSLITGDVDWTGTANDSDISGFQIGIAPGFSYFFTPKWSLDVLAGNFGYTGRTVTTNGNEVDNNSFAAQIDFSNINIGLSFFFKSN